MRRHRVLALVWSGMGWWRWLALLLVSIALALTPLAGPSRPEWHAVPPLTGPEGFPVTLESRCLAATGRCEWRLRIEGEGGYRWRHGAAETWRVIASDPDNGLRTVTIVPERERVEACAAAPLESCAHWSLGDSALPPR